VLRVKGVQLILGWEFGASRCRLKGGVKTSVPSPWSIVMSTLSFASAAAETREQRVESIMAQLRPKIDAVVRQLVERAVDVPEAEEFGPIDFEFRDAGQAMVNEVRQASVASRKKRGT